jgi:septal ring factor EnvC (AmiA/AmiB activator)
LIGDLTAHKNEIDANVISMLEERSKLETKLFPDGENSETPDTALPGHVDEVTELRQAIVDLAKRNQELEADVASLAGEKATLASMLASEKRKLTKRAKEATERRKKFESKLADMSDRLSDVLDDDHDDDKESSFELKADSDNATH